jgi:glycine/D-amino acid oxidase-like deaminating enzyme
VALSEPVVLNCTGLGARALFGDLELEPVRGQLTFLLPQPEVDYIVIKQGGYYMFPRRDGILLGGTFDHGNWSLEPDEGVRARILAGHRALFEGMR